MPPDDDDLARTARLANQKTQKAKKFVVDGILPRGMVHLIAAPVGTGKTTLFMQQLDSIQRGAQFLGRDTYPANIVYITADRGEQESHNTIERLGLKIDMRIVSLKDTKKSVIPYLETLIETYCRRDDLVIVEPLNFFIRDANNRTGDINSFGHVSHFLLNIGRMARDMNLTVEGSLHSSKAKAGSGYAVPREKVIGSVAWTAFTSTTIVMEPADPKTPEDPGRTIYVLPRDERPFTLEYVVDSDAGGLLVPQAVFARRYKSNLDKFLDAHPHETFTNLEVESWKDTASVSVSTAYRWLEQKIKNGEVERVEKGVYKKRRVI
jgi:RecA-family ATPase